MIELSSPKSPPNYGVTICLPVNSFLHFSPMTIQQHMGITEKKKKKKQIGN